MTKRTARDKLLALATDKNAWPYPEQVTNLLDAYRAEVLAEARKAITAASNARLDEIDEDDLCPSDWERHEQWCDAADVLKRAADAR